MTAVRPAVTADIPAIAAILAANDEPIDWPDLPGWPYLEHLLARARVSVAEAGGAIVGFAGAIDRGEARFLTDLFVDPAFHERGAGRALLEAVLGDASGTDDVQLGGSAGARALHPLGDATLVAAPLSHRGGRRTRPAAGRPRLGTGVS